MQPTIADILEQKRLQTPEAVAQQQESNFRQVQTQQLSSIEQSIKTAVSGLISYMDGKITKTEVINQLKEIGTPDALKVVEAVNQLHATLKTHKNTDLSEITTVMKAVLDEAKKIPKQTVTIPEVKLKDYSKDFANLASAVKGVEKVVKAQKLIAQAPVVNVPETKVNVAPPNLLPLQSSISEVVTAIKSIVIPEYKTDNTEVEKLLKKSNKLLADLLEKPMGGSFSGGGGRATPYESSSGDPRFVTLDSDGNIPVSSPSYATKITTSGTDTYVGEAAPGSAQSSAVWRIQKVDSGGNVTWKDGNANFDNTATDLTTGSFS